MKKFLAMILMVMFAVSISITAMSEEVEIDLTSLSLEELIELRDSATQEIYLRIGFSFEDNQIVVGSYLVGQDIKPGKYEFICTYSETETHSDGSSMSFCNLVVYAENDENSEKLFKYYYLPVGQKVAFSLEEGQLLQIDRGHGLIQEVHHSWAP